jgi:hypothetical protein
MATRFCPFHTSGLLRAWPAVLLLSARIVQAQTAPEAPPPTEPPPPAAVATPQPSTAPEPIIVPAPPVAAPAPAVVSPAVEVVAPPPPPAPDDPKKSPLSLNAWMHMSNRLQNFKEPKKLNRFSQENELNLLFNAQVYKMIGFTADLAATYGPTSPTDGSIQGSVAILDLIAKLDFDDAFHLWAGRMLVPSDRSNFSGTWFMAPWYYPGRYFGPTPEKGANNFFGAPIGPRQGPYGRNDGATIWGEFGGGTLKYYAGVYDVFANNNPLISGRINLALINPEPGYYHSSTYYGSKDILALAISGQYQKSKGDVKDYGNFNADLLFEKNTGSGTIDIEGTFYKYFNTDIDFNYYALISYLTPQKLGPGALQPLLRLQQAKPMGSDMWTMVDVQLGYVVDTYAARFALGYQYSSVAGLKGNAIYLGVQLQK